MEDEFDKLIEEQNIEIWIEGLADTLQYLTLTDTQGHDEECRNACMTVACVRELLQTMLEERKACYTNIKDSECERNEEK
jgi:hypothetical protein